MTSLERSLVRILPFLGVGLVAALPLLLVPQPDDPLVASLVHLSGVVGLGLIAALTLAPLADDTWYQGTGLGRWLRLLVSGIGIIVLVTGMVGLVTLATGAALRFDPSLQFLQLLSALDIAWAGAAIVIGGYRWRGPWAGAVGGVVLGVACVWSIWRYLDEVGFTAAGGWVVDGGKLMTLVIPADMIAATVAVVVYLAGTRHAYRTEQASAQS